MRNLIFSHRSFLKILAFTLLFDNDGTLVDTERLFFRAASETFADAGIELTREWYLEHVLRHHRSSFELAKAKGLSESELLLLRKKRDAYYCDILSGEVAALDGVLEVLDSLSKSYRIGVVTSSWRQHFEIMMAKTGIGKYIDFSVTNDDVVRDKPHPEPYLKGIELSKSLPRHILAFEDAEGGLASAKAAGLHSVVIPSASEIVQDYRLADVILESFRDIPRYLQTINPV